MVTPTFTACGERLFACLPSDNDRYSKRSCVTTQPATLTSASHLFTNVPVPAYLDHDWRHHVHPEGKPYKSRGTTPTVVTEAHIEDAAVAHQVNSWEKFLADLASENQLKLHAGVELFLDLDVSGGTCYYYYVDHATRAVFWLHSYETNQLGLPPTFSDRHLKQAIEQNYWTHVEMFCMHLQSLPQDCLEELMSLFMHGQIDHMTSYSSTFPYAKDDCAETLKILELCRSMPHNPNTFTFIARLWAHVASSRVLTHYGEDHCRLDRTTTIYAPKIVKQSRLLNATSRVFFRLPDAMCEKLEDQYVDELVTKHQWSIFVQNRLADWKLSMQWTFALLLANAVSLPTAYSPVLAHSSMLMCATGLLVGAALCVRHQDLVDADAPEAATFLSEQQTTSGFQRLATLYTTPKAFFIWALVLFVVQMVCVLLAPLPLLYSLLAGAVLGGVAVSIFRALNPGYTLPFSKIPLPYFNRDKKDYTSV